MGKQEEATFVGELLEVLVMPSSDNLRSALGRTRRSSVAKPPVRQKKKKKRELEEGASGLYRIGNRNKQLEEALRRIRGR